MTNFPFQINPVKLTDGSKVYNVVARLSDHMITIGCVSEQAARTVRDALNDQNLVAWIQVD